MRILTGIDLPFEPSCGSLILANDIYSNLPKGVTARFLGLESGPTNTSWSGMQDVVLLDCVKISDPAGYPAYVDELYAQIVKHVADFQPDIIHVQHLSFGMALAFSRLKNIPKIAICHGTDILYSMGNDFHKNNVITVCKAADRVIFPTVEMYSDFKRVIGLELGNKVKIIYWGIPATQKPFQRKKLDANNIRLLYAGRITEDKGIDVLVRALERLPKKFSLTIIGSGTYENEIRELVKVKHLSQRIKIIPFMKRTMLWEEFLKHDAIIIPTREIESFCLVAVEAQAHGLPVIFSNTSGLREVIGGFGMAFKPMDSADLAVKILAMSGSSTYKSYLPLCRQNADRFRIEDTIENLIDCSKNLL